jgi:2-(1,2-epoxy-1,2-dihydrophenyl)acetyl-CoA isomerase
VVTLDRRERFNSLDLETAQDLRRAALRLARDREVGAIVLRGGGGVFCSGVDLQYVRGGGGADDLSCMRREDAGAGYGAMFKQVLEYLNGAIFEIRRAPKPVIAAVDGVAAAGGLGIALCCDLVLASERASFEWAYGKTALSGAESATFLLPRWIGFGRAMHMAMLSPRVAAPEALRIGLASEMLPTEGFDQAAMRIARRAAETPREAFARMKRLLNQAAGMDALERHLAAEVEELVSSAESAEFAEGLDRFLGRGSRRARPDD